MTAWGDPAVTLWCAAGLPPQLDPGSPSYDPVGRTTTDVDANGVCWLADESQHPGETGPRSYTPTTMRHRVVLEVRAPARYTGAESPLGALTPASPVPIAPTPPGASPAPDVHDPVPESAWLDGVMGRHVQGSERRRSSENAARRSFAIDVAGGFVPGTVWTPTSSAAPVPLVLLGHGGSGHRHGARILSLADGITRSGCAAAAIDGPYHGERVPAPLPPAEYQSRIAAEGIGRVLDRVADEWVAARDVLVDAGIADRARQAYVGLSMGTRFGLAAAVALGAALRCAVFGKFGTHSADTLHPGLQAPERALTDASRITAPVLFHLQWDDELFPRPGQLELFDAFPSPAKELHAFAGCHGDTPAHAPATWLAFLDRHLA